MEERIQEFLNWTMWEILVLVVLVWGIYGLQRILKEISDNVNTIRVQQRGIFDDYEGQAEEWLNRNR